MLKTYYEKKCKITCLVICLLSMMISKAQTAYAGRWIRNNEKTNPGGLSMNSVPVSIDIKDSRDEIEFTRISRNRFDSTFSYYEKLRFDDSPTVSYPKPDLQKFASVHWSSDRKILLLNARYANINGNLVQTVRESWVLENNGLTLRIESILDADGKTYTLSEIFDRQ